MSGQMAMGAGVGDGVGAGGSGLPPRSLPPCSHTWMPVGNSLVMSTKNGVTTHYYECLWQCIHCCLTSRQRTAGAP
jgi:hypothetical protein